MLFERGFDSSEIPTTINTEELARIREEDADECEAEVRSFLIVVFVRLRVHHLPPCTVRITHQRDERICVNDAGSFFVKRLVQRTHPRSGHHRANAWFFVPTQVFHLSTLHLGRNNEPRLDGIVLWLRSGEHWL